jgi:dihydrodipicolinate synthase/N-acetylneuraminate lyase
MLSANDFRGVYAIIPSPAKEGADRADAVDTVDLDETARVTDQLIKDGVAGILTLGTTGECATLTQDEWESFVDCFLSTVNKRVPAFVGTTALGTHAIVQRIRYARDRGADGTLLGMPMWQPCTLDMAREFYGSISDLFPDFAIMVYGNENAFRFHWSPETWGPVAARAKTIVATKGGAANELVELVKVTKGQVKFLPNDGAVMRNAEADPDHTTACWSTAASMGPQPAIALMDAILARDWERAKEIAADIRWAGETFMAPERRHEFGSYNIQLEKGRINAAGYCKAGPYRPPYNVIPADLAEGAAENGRRWAQLQKKYSEIRAQAVRAG